MTSFGSRPLILALFIAAASTAWAKDTPAPDCDAFCHLRTYVEADHMVTMAPAQQAPLDHATTLPRKAKTAARPARVKPKVVARRPAPTPPVLAAAPPERTAPVKTASVHRSRLARQTRPAATIVAAVPEAPAPAIVPPPARPAGLIPGSAPMMSAQFETPVMH